MVLLTCTVAEGMCDKGGDKKYMYLTIGGYSETVRHIHENTKKPVQNLVDPLYMDVLRVKIPFRYNRIMCPMTGNKTIQELVPGDRVTVELKYCGWWESDGFGGPSWKILSCQA